MFTIIDTQAYSPDEYNIVALPSKPFLQHISEIQKQLLHILGDAIWLTPIHALHITVMEITGPHTQPVSLRGKHFAQWQVRYGDLVKEVISNFRVGSLHFDQIIVSQRAVILKAANPDLLNEIRKELLTKTNLPEGTNLPPDIAHITIARFSKAVELNKAIQATEELKIDYTEPITSFSLLKDITPPDFNISCIDTYRLAS